MSRMGPRIYWLFLQTTALLALAAALAQAVPPQHSSNYAVVVSASRYWFNYRHAVNALVIYDLLRQGGFDDDHIILMSADEFPTNSRNPVKNSMYATSVAAGPSLYNATAQIDYRGDDVTVQNFVNVLTGRAAKSLPVLQSNKDSNVLIYLSGHGGDEFFKFQDEQEITSAEIAGVIRQMHDAGRYREILLVADTCEAFTLGKKLTAEHTPNVTMIGSSLRGESSYAHHSDTDLGLSVIERYTYAFTEHVKVQGMQGSLQETMVDPYSFQQQRAHVGASDECAVRKLHQVLLSDFFSNVQTKKESSVTHSVQYASSSSRLTVGLPPVPPPPLGVSVVTEARQCSINEVGQCSSSDDLPLVNWETWEPSDPGFLAAIALLACGVVMASRIW